MSGRHFYFKENIIENSELSTIFEYLLGKASESKKQLMIFVNSKKHYGDTLKEVVGTRIGTKLLKNEPVTLKSGVEIILESSGSIKSNVYRGYDIIFSFHTCSKSLEILDTIENFNLIFVASEEEKSIDPWIEKHQAQGMTIKK